MLQYFRLQCVSDLHACVVSVRSFLMLPVGVGFLYDELSRVHSAASEWGMLSFWG